MSGLGEWDEPEGVEEPPSGEVQTSPYIADELVATFGQAVVELDVRALAHQTVSGVIARQVNKAVASTLSTLVNDVAQEVFTPETLAMLQAEADAGARAALRGETLTSTAEEEPAQLHYGSVDEFVREFVVPVYARRVGERAERRWSARWWENTEAIIRLESLWRAWEHLRLDPATGMSVFLRDHLDHHMAILMSPDGPFRDSKDEVRAGPLPYKAPPVGLFPDLREQS